MFSNYIQANGYFIDYKMAGCHESETHHVFCGTHDIKGAICPNCKKPLLKFLTLDLLDDRLIFKINNLHKLHLLFCWTCNIAQSLFCYKLLNDNEIKILSFGAGGVEEDFPYVNYPDFFPERTALLIPVSKKEQTTIVQLNTGSDEVDEWQLMQTQPELVAIRHQVGGFPRLVNPDVEAVACPSCEKPTALVASIADDCVDPRGFTGNPYVQVLFFCCNKCATICVLQQCD